MTAPPESSPPVRRERVALPGRETDVTIGSGVRNAVWEALGPRFPGARRCGVVVDDRVASLWSLPPVPPELGWEVVECVVPAGEAAKERSVLATLQDRLLVLRREEPVVVFGGGATIDVGGFAAATVRRGLPWVAVATTVIAMADASVGGKVAVNHPRGKNLLGTFHPPCHVFSDVETLGTLDPRERRSGLAEIYKCGRIRDDALIRLLRAGPPATSEAWVDVIHRCVAVKARIVEQDERDLGERRLLNYGHTVGHGLERVLSNEALRHGEGVAIGMAAAARIAVARGLLSAEEADRQTRDLEDLGLDTKLPAGVDPAALLEKMGYDKKRRPGEAHVFVLPVGGGGVRVCEDVTEDEVRAALA
jgi:3-dehydroquinate synthetase